MTIRPAPASAEAVPTAGEQARRVLRRWPTLLLVWGLVLLLALLLGLLTPRSYTASTEVRGGSAELRGHRRPRRARR
ncbi:hypothetical protein A5N15_00975 [Rothia kristinae]|uniref:Uncharacterized protein n=1 Tax=Rothia kristinae TaxID=37923 RepID=A0A657IW18_9MICC|nr:hypothetical protein A5N15_00975 [Rothia kristinae]